MRPSPPITPDHPDQGKLSRARHHFHSAALIGQRETAARASPLMRKHQALARRLLKREHDYLTVHHRCAGAI